MQYFQFEYRSVSCGCDTGSLGWAPTEPLGWQANLQPERVCSKKKNMLKVRTQENVDLNFKAV
jgi:hypothetical protein